MLVKIHYLGATNMVMGLSVEDLIERSIKKFNLPQNKYKITLLDGTIMDDDDILKEYVKVMPPTVSLRLSLENALVTDQPPSLVDNLSAQQSSSQSTTFPPASAPAPASSRSINWEKFIKECATKDLIKLCEQGKEPSADDRKILVHTMASRMRDDLKIVDRGSVGDVAKKLCSLYPSSFQDKIGGEVCGTGYATFRNQLYSRIHYQQGKAKARTSTKRPAISDDDDEDAPASNNSRGEESSRVVDEYGCVAYAPLLPKGETPTSQEEKRNELMQLFEEISSDEDKIRSLMKATYATQRRIIIEKTRNLKEITTSWPYLKIADHLLAHCSELVGKNLKEKWNDSKEKLFGNTQKYLKNYTIKEKTRENARIGIINDYKEAKKVEKSEIPKNVSTFPLLALYFKEDINSVIKVIDADVPDSEIQKYVDGIQPLLVIRGHSIYDSDAVCTVVFEKEIIVFCSDILEGIFVTLASYYVFGYLYRPTAAKTLEFIQRQFLGINPPKGTKKPKSKRSKNQDFDVCVFKLAQKIVTYNSSFVLNKE